MKTVVVKIGRDLQNNIVLPDQAHKISRFHAELRLKPNGDILLFDKSANGTTVNGRPVPKEKEFFVYRTDRVEFASIAVLDWSKVPNAPSEGSVALKSKPSGAMLVTDFWGDMGRVVNEAADSSEVFQSLYMFWRMSWSGGSNIAIKWANEIKTQQANPLRFFITGVGLFIFCVVFIFGKIVENNADSFPPHIVHLFKMDFATEFVLAILMAILSYGGAVIFYKVFKVLLSSPKRWRHYNRLYVLNAGFTFFGFAIYALPLTLPLAFDPRINSPISSILLILTVILWCIHAIWSTLLMLRVHKKFWEISYSLTILIFLAIGLVISFSFRLLFFILVSSF